MKAVVVISLTPKGEGMAVELSAKWTDGSGPQGDLSAIQILAILDQARGGILANVPFEVPSKVKVVGSLGALSRAN